MPDRTTTSTPTGADAGDLSVLAPDGGTAIRVLAGDCTVVFDGDRREEYRGKVTIVIKPDNTVLVHDADGYQPVAWLTRAESVSCSRGGMSAAGAMGGSTDGDGDPTHASDGGAAFTVDARDGDARLRVTAHAEDGYATYPASVAGRPVADCPDCGGTLVRTSGAIACLGCAASYGLPGGATVTDRRCDCGLPRVRVERGEPLDVCLDRECEPLLEVVRERFDREWDCPACGSDLRIVSRGRILAGCAAYPDCDVALTVPTGTVVDECGCGLPVFEAATGRRCLDSTCDRHGHP